MAAPIHILLTPDEYTAYLLDPDQQLAQLALQHSVDPDAIAESRVVWDSTYGGQMLTMALAGGDPLPPQALAPDPPEAEDDAAQESLPLLPHSQTSEAPGDANG